jgi:hypothetical protein
MTMEVLMAIRPAIATAISHIAQSSATWADVSNFLFDPEHGLLVRAYPNRKQRERLLKSEEYQKIRATLLTTMQRTGLAAWRNAGEERQVCRPPSQVAARLAGARSSARGRQPESTRRH